MIRKITLIIFVILVFSATGCVKETYDMNKVSTKVQLSPSIAVAAFKGGVTLSDIVKTADTVIYDQSKFAKFVFKKDAIIDLKLIDFYDLTNMVTFTQSYTIGELNIDPFSLPIKYSISPVAALISTTPKLIPAFGSTNLGKQTFSFSNFESAVFSAGTLSISITNNLPVDLKPISVTLYHGTGATPPLFVPAFNIPLITKGNTQTYTIDLANKTLNNPISAAVVLSGCDGSGTNTYIINQSNSNIQVTISGSGLKVKSGRVKLPSQPLLSVDKIDTISFNPGTGVEIDQLHITTGNLSYQASSAAVSGALTLTLPGAKINNIAISKVINFGPSATPNGMILFDNAVVDMTTISARPYNQIPFNYTIDVNSNGALVNFNSTDKIQLSLKLQNPVLDYVKGYFGQSVETITPDSVDLGIQEILGHLTGGFFISNPSIKINYSNSFAIPLQINFNAIGKRKSKPSINLNLAPQSILSGTISNREVSATIAVNKANSKIDSLISMLPEVISFSGSAKMNPSVNPLGVHPRDNYVFGNSRFLGALEIEVPLEFHMNLEVTDTVDNFLKSSINSDSPVKPENFKKLSIKIAAQNGFPLGVSIKMTLYNPVTKKKSVIDATDLLKPAPVDANGKSTGMTETNTTLDFTQDFFSSISTSDKIIFTFGLKTSENGVKDIKIYSDTRIDYSAAVVAQPDIIIK